MKVHGQYQENYGNDVSDISSVLRIQNLQISLEKAIGQISLLQQNLAYVLKVNEQLETEIGVKNKREQALVKECEKELAKKERELESCKIREQQILNLLEDTKSELENEQLSRRQREDEVRRMQKIINDQKATNHALEEELLTAKYSSDLSFQNMTQDNMRVAELERENDQLAFELKKIKVQMEKEAAKSRKLQKQLEVFKCWLGKVLGVRKVIEGCQSMFLEEISNRLANSTPY